MKAIIIRLPDVEAAMLVELGKADKNFKDPSQMLAEMLRAAYTDIRKAKKRL